MEYFACKIPDGVENLIKLHEDSDVDVILGGSCSRGEYYASDLNTFKF